MSMYNNVFTIDSEPLKLDFEIIMGGGKLPSYEGEYTVTPKAFIEQTLETKNKSMASDVTVLEIPYSEVSNPEGGITVNIAYEL